MPADEVERLLVSEEKDKAQINSFIEQRLKTNTVSFWDAIPNLKINDKEDNNQINQLEACDVDGTQGSIWKIDDGCKRPAGQRERDPLL